MIERSFDNNLFHYFSFNRFYGDHHKKTIRLAYISSDLNSEVNREIHEKTIFKNWVLKRCSS